jgi:hypothetical protein
MVVLGVPALLAGWWRDLAGRHPVAAIIMAVVLAAVLGMLSLLFLVAGREVGAYLTQLGSALGLVSVISGYDRRYCAWLATTVDRVQASQRPTAAPFAPALEEVFVEPGLVPRPPHQISTGMVSSGTAGGRHRRPLADFLRRDQPGVLAVVGAPGSGKTTLLRNTARRIARERVTPVPLLRRIAGLVVRPPRGQRRRVPILLELRSHAPAVVADPQVTLAQLVSDAKIGQIHYEPPGWWEDRLRRGRCIVLLDGLDEVSADPGNPGVAAWINRQIARYPGNDYVVTSRPHTYRTDVVDRARILQIWPFTDTEARKFVHNWYRAVEEHTGGTGPEVNARTQAQADDLLARLARLPALRDLTVNPLLLDMIVKVHMFRKELPQNRAELYREICEWTLWRLRETRNLPTIVPGPDIQRLLAALAYTMMDQRVRDLRHDDVVAVLQPSLRRLGTKVAADAFLAEVRTSGLLVEQGAPATYTFAHQTFQEYLAAVHVRERRLRNTLLRHVDDPWWRETIVLYAASGDATAVVRACLDTDTAATLSVGFECAETLVGNGIELDTAVRARLDNTIASAFADAADAERRRMVAGVLAARAFRQPLRTADGIRIAAHPIGTDLYRLFLQDTGSPPPDRPGPAEPTASVPASGMWGGEARLFVDWLNTAAGTGQPLYRLPTRQDLDDLVETGGEAPDVQALLSSISSVWVQLPTPGRGPAALGLWTVPGKHPTNSLDGTALLDTIASDTVQSRLMHQLLSLNLYLVAERLGLTLDRATRLAKTYGLLLDQVISGAPAADQARRESLLRDLAQARTPALTPTIPAGRMSGKEAQRLAGRNLVPDPQASVREVGLRNEIDRLGQDYSAELAEVAAQSYRLLDALTNARDAARALAAAFTSKPAPGNRLSVPILALDGSIGLLRHLLNKHDEVHRLSRRLQETNKKLGRTIGTSEQIMQHGAIGTPAKQWARELADSLNRTLDLCRSRSRDIQPSRLLALDCAYRLVPPYARELETKPHSEQEASDSEPLVPLVGNALGCALGAVLDRQQDDPSPAERTFAAALLKAANQSAPPARYTVGLDGVTEAVQVACAALTTGINHKKRTAIVATRLEPAARELLTRHKPVDPRAAANIRLAALALADAASNKDNNPHLSALQNLAAAVALRQTRANSTEPLEILLLAQV